MHRSNPLRLAAGLLFLTAIGLMSIADDLDLHTNLFLLFLYLCLASAIGFWMWRHSLRRTRLIAEIPTSKIVSAAQGYVELVGRAQPGPSGLIAGIANVACVWYRYEIAQRKTEGRRSIFNLIYLPVEVKASLSDFIIDDGTGQATVYPYRAEMICSDRQVWYEGDTRYTEERIMPGDNVYILGDFSTYDGAHARFDVNDATLTQISVWQQDKEQLLLRFDKNGNGFLDSNEWEAMHNAARASVTADNSALHAGSPRHLISYPRDARHYLIATQAPAKLMGHFVLWRNLGLVLFFAGGLAAVWLAGVLAIV